MLDVLHGEIVTASPRALAFAALIRAQAAGAAVVDVLAAGNGCYWWTGDNEQHGAMLDMHPVRLAA